MRHALATFVLLSSLLSSALPCLDAEELITPSIVGGTDAASGAYPWMVALVRFDREDILDGQFCGGMLIHPQWVLTAAHCVSESDIDIFEVAVGNGDLNAAVDLHRVNGIFIHPDADSLRISRGCDIALIRLQDPILDVEPIPLERAASALVTGRRIRNLGWGATDYEATERTGPNLLQEVEGFLSEIGVNSYEENHPIRDYYVQVERANPMRGTFSGDSGGPLLIESPDDGQWKLAGVTSFGGRNFELQISRNFYSTVAYAAPWIDAHINPPLRSPLARTHRGGYRSSR